MNPHEALQSAVGSFSHVFLYGPNFSGRTAALQHLTHLSADSAPGGFDDYGNQLPVRPHASNVQRFAYVGPEIYQSLSGLAGNVRAELSLHSWVPAEVMGRVAEQLGLTPLFGQGCFDLSGGQQALLAGASAALLQPRILALDCCLEQVDTTLRDKLLLLLAEVAPDTLIALADNEIQELPMLPGTYCLHLDAPEGRVPWRPIDEALCRECLPPRTAASFLELRHLSFNYDRTSTVLRDVNITLEPGRVYWLRGPNGAGKSTMAKLLAGVLKPLKGEVVVSGTASKPHNSPGSLAAYHFQNPDFQLFTTTVGDEVLAGPRAMGCTSAEASWRSDRVLAQMGFPKELLQTHPLDLPFALRKRLALASTISQGSPWIILDEPTLNQDALNTSAIRSLLRGLAEAGTGVIVISHSRSLLQGLPVTELRLEGGRIEWMPESTANQKLAMGDLTSNGEAAT